MNYMILFLLLFTNLSSNQLKYETSPYLQQHVNNPVDWYAWSDLSLKKAKKENKLIFLSIGYSTCHWCHEMAKESFENIELAEILNKYYVSIKVDREEMPHIDSLYQKIHKDMKGYPGGWPLNVFLTPDMKPLYISAYIPSKTTKEYVGLDTLLVSIKELYDANKIPNNKDLNRHYLGDENMVLNVDSLVDSIVSSYDEFGHGFGDTTKFPEASKLELMMDLYMLTHSKQIENYIKGMLDSIALKGIYDHIDGGFFRYSVDEHWEIPHFEKMLYTQGEMISVFSRAYMITGKKLYRDIVSETIDMLDRRFMNNNLYYSASDAGRGLNEGKYFVFTKGEMDYVIENSKNKSSLLDSLDDSLNGNFGSSIHIGFSGSNRPNGFVEFRDSLANIRNLKEFPFIDKKINTAWNALVIEGLYNASIVDKSYIEKADKHIDRLQEKMFNKGELYHQSLLHLKPTQLGLLEDYSFFISALLSAYEVTLDESKLDFAIYLFMKAKSKFYSNGIWYLSDDGLKVESDLNDIHYVSAVSKMIQNIIKLASIKSSRDYIRIAIESIKRIEEKIISKQSEVPAAARAFLMNTIGYVIVKNSKSILKEELENIKKVEYPYIVFKSNNSKKYLACTNSSCFAVEDSVSAIKKAIIDIKQKLYTRN